MMDILKDLELKIAEITRNFKDGLSGIRGGRPSTKLVEDIPVDYFGQKLSVKQVGTASIFSPREIHISVWDKDTAPLVHKAVGSANINAGVSLEGNLVRINLPPLSGERRQELVKIAGKEAEEARIRIRGARDEINKEISRQLEDKKITEDDKFKNKEKVQEKIDEANREIEKLLENKIKEIEE